MAELEPMGLPLWLSLTAKDTSTHVSSNPATAGLKSRNAASPDTL